MKKHLWSVISIIAVVCCVFAANPISFAACASAAPTAPVRRALVMSAVIDNGAISQGTVTCMHNAFVRNGITTTDYIQDPNDENTSNFLNAIISTFEDATAQDVSYIFINSHGNQFGGLHIFGQNDMRHVTMAALRTAIDQIDGHVVILINACHSGAAIGRDVSSESRVDSIDEVMKNMFLFGTEEAPRSGEFSDIQRFTVFCSSLQAEPSWGYVRGCVWAAIAWAKGAGYKVSNVITGTGDNTNRESDFNNDGIVTASEYYDYCSVAEYNNNEYLNNAQTMCYYSATPCYTIFTNDYALGDIDKNNAVNLQDLLKLRQHVEGTTLLSGRSFDLADMDANGTLTSADVLLLRQYLSYVLS